MTFNLTATEKGRHTELLAQTALLANGWTVLEPIAAEPFDLAITKIGSRKTHYVQVKTSFRRKEKRYAGEYVVVRGSKGNGDVYKKDEVDYFVTVVDNDVYIFPNQEKSEYWVKKEHVDVKWTKLRTEIKGGNVD